MKSFHWLLLASMALTIASCNHSAGNKACRTPLQDSLLQRVDDSIRLQSPHALDLVREGMASAKDSVTYYEYELRKSCAYFLMDKSDSTRYYADRALAFALRQKPVTPRLHDIMGLAYMMRAAQFYHYKNHTDSVFYYYRLCIEHINQSSDKAKLPNICANVADAYEQENDIPKAALWFRRALFLSDSLNMPKATNVSINMGLAQVYMQLRDFESAHQCYRNTEQHYDELDPNMQMQFLNNYGNFYYYTKDYPDALKLFLKVKKLQEKSHNDSFDYYVCLLNMADVYMNMGRLDLSKHYLSACEPFFIKNKVDVAIYYVNTVKIGLALKEGDIAGAKKIIENETVAAPNEPNIVNIRNGYMREYYARTGNYREAYRQLTDYMATNDTLEQNKTHMRAAEIMMRFQQDTLALHHQIAIQAKEKEVSKAYNYIVIATALVIIIALLFFINIIHTRRRRLQGQVRMLQLRLANIRNRISPHFIFNVLNNIINKHEKISSDDLLAVTQFIRRGIDMSRHIYATLKEELDFTTLYVDATRQIIDDDFEFIVNKPDDATLESIVIPSMFLQILVENSIKHGLADKEGHKCLTITIQHDETCTSISVTDNGTGFRVDKSNNGSTKTGLNVIRQTIYIINKSHKQKLSFEIHNTTDDAGRVTGCEAQLHIPTKMELEEKFNDE
jgi:tetratricopeptide (TPR) repeat protein/two-component sensor histidine kinase